MNQQILIRWGNEKDALVRFLKRKGYTSRFADQLAPANAVPVYCVDTKTKEYFLVTATVCAAFSQANRPARSFQEARALL